MPTTRVRDSESLEGAVRRFRRACERAGILSELRHREFYEKPTWARKRKKNAALKRHRKTLRLARQQLRGRR